MQGLPLILTVTLALASGLASQPKRIEAKQIAPVPKGIEAQQIKLYLGPADADQLDDSPWGVSLSFYARFNKDGTVDRGNQGITHESVTNDQWGFGATMAPHMASNFYPVLREIAWMPEVTARIEGQLASSYTDGKPEYSDDGKVITQVLAVRIERILRTDVTALFAGRKLEFHKKERSNAVSFDVVLKMKAGEFSVSALPPSKQSLGSDGWSKKSVTKVGRLAKDPEPDVLGLGSAKCRAELSTRKLPGTDDPPAEKFPKKMPGKALPKKLPG